MNINGELYDIEALKFGGKTYEELLEFLNSVSIIVSKDAANTPLGVSWSNGVQTIVGTLAPENATNGAIYLVKHTHTEGPLEGDKYDEYIVADSKWEKIGNTDIDLTNYAKKGTETSGASANVTGEPTDSSASVSTEPFNHGTVTTGTATITYKKAKASTEAYENKGSEIYTGAGTAHKHTFTGTAGTVTIDSSGTAQQDGAHTHTVSGDSIPVVTSYTVSSATIYTAPTITGEEANHTHTVEFDSHSHQKAVKAVTSITWPTPTETTTSSVASVSNNVLYIGYAFGGNSTTTQKISVVSTSGSFTTTDVAGVTITEPISVTSSAAGEHTHSILGSEESVVTSISFDSDKALYSVSVDAVEGHTHSVSTSGSTSFTPAGTLSEEGAHKHYYNPPSSHSHTISFVDDTVNGDVSVFIGSHDHKVSIIPHTHSMTHTHTQQ